MLLSRTFISIALNINSKNLNNYYNRHRALKALTMRYRSTPEILNGLVYHRGFTQKQIEEKIGCNEDETYLVLTSLFAAQEIGNSPNEQGENYIWVKPKGMAAYYENVYLKEFASDLTKLGIPVIALLLSLFNFGYAHLKQETEKGGLTELRLQAELYKASVNDVAELRQELETIRVVQRQALIPADTTKQVQVISTSK